VEGAIKRMVRRLFPELTAGYHLPRFGQVVAVRETPGAGMICDDFRPGYAVDVQILDEQGRVDTNFPVFRDVILPVPVAGHEMGVYAYPEDGTWVEIAFAYGSPNCPFIRCILPHGRSLIPTERGEHRWQHNSASFQRVDKDGSWETVTDQAIHEQSVQRNVEAMHNVEAFTESVKTTDADDLHSVGGALVRKAFGLIQLLSGGRLDIAALRDITITTQQEIQGHADVKQHYEAPLTWLGSTDENVLLLLSELHQQVIDLCAVLDSHTHPGAGVIDQGAEVAAVGAATTAVKGRLDGIAESI